MNLITAAEFEDVLSAIKTIFDRDVCKTLMRMTVELGAHRALALNASGKLVAPSLSSSGDQDSSTTPQAGDSGFSFSPDEPAEILQPTHAGDSEICPSDEPAPAFRSSPKTQKGETGGGTPAPHPLAEEPPFPDRSRVWKAKYTPDQLDSVLQLIRFALPGTTDREIASASGVSDITVRDIRKGHIHRIDWLLSQPDEGLCLDHLAKLRAINEQRPGAKPAAPVPAATKPAVAVQPPPTPTPDYGDLDSSRFGTPPVTREPGAMAKRVRLTADAILGTDKPKEATP